MFAAAVVVSVRRGRTVKPIVATPPSLADNVISQGGPGHVDTRTAGKGGISLKFGNQVTYADNRTKFGGGVRLDIPDKNGRSIAIESQEAQITRPPGDPTQAIGDAVFSGGVTLTTSDGITVTAPTGTYNQKEQIARIPGNVAFKKGRMTGTS